MAVIDPKRTKERMDERLAMMHKLYSDSEVRHIFSPSKPITNADRIRSMADEELAEMLSEPFPYNCARQKCNYHWKTCKECALDWLRQEAVDNGACSVDETSEKVQNE